jgi:hypothetical protein
MTIRFRYAAWPHSCLLAVQWQSYDMTYDMNILV